MSIAAGRLARAGRLRFAILRSKIATLRDRPTSFRPAMPLTVNCPKCSRRYQAPDTLAGRQAKCGCGAVFDVPGLASGASAPAAATMPRTAAARPVGSWQSQSAAAPAPMPAAGSSVFDDISPADLNRGKAKAAAVVAIADNPALSPSGSISGDVMARVRNEIIETERIQAEKLPHSVSLAIAGLVVPGILSLALGFWFLLALGSNFIEDFGSEFMIFMFIVCALFAALDITAGALIYMRVPFARPLGYVAGAITLCTGCGNPANFICGLLTLWFLSTPETGVYLSRKGALGVIDW
jgi:hypothetical protein